MNIVTIPPRPNAPLNWYSIEARTDNDKTSTGYVTFYAGSPDVPAHVYSVMVYRKWWRQGIGTAMMREVERIRRQHGAKEISLYNAGGDRSRGLYQKVGYEMISSLPEQHNLMIRELQ